MGMNKIAAIIIASFIGIGIIALFFAMIKNGSYLIPFILMPTITMVLIISRKGMITTGSRTPDVVVPYNGISGKLEKAPFNSVQCRCRWKFPRNKISKAVKEQIENEYDNDIWCIFKDMFFGTITFDSIEFESLFDEVTSKGSMNINKTFIFWGTIGPGEATGVKYAPLMKRLELADQIMMNNGKLLENIMKNAEYASENLKKDITEQIGIHAQWRKDLSPQIMVMQKGTSPMIGGDIQTQN